MKNEAKIFLWSKKLSPYGQLSPMSQTEKLHEEIRKFEIQFTLQSLRRNLQDAYVPQRAINALVQFEGRHEHG